MHSHLKGCVKVKLNTIFKRLIIFSVLFLTGFSHPNQRFLVESDHENLEMVLSYLSYYSGYDLTPVEQTYNVIVKETKEHTRFEEDILYVNLDNMNQVSEQLLLNQLLNSQFDQDIDYQNQVVYEVSRNVDLTALETAINGHLNYLFVITDLMNNDELFLSKVKYRNITKLLTNNDLGVVFDVSNSTLTMNEMVSDGVRPFGVYVKELDQIKDTPATTVFLEVETSNFYPHVFNYEDKTVYPVVRSCEFTRNPILSYEAILLDQTCEGFNDTVLPFNYLDETHFIKTEDITYFINKDFIYEVSNQTLKDKFFENIYTFVALFFGMVVVLFLVLFRRSKKKTDNDLFRRID